MWIGHSTLKISIRKAMHLNCPAKKKLQSRTFFQAFSQLFLETASKRDVEKLACI